MSREDSTQPLMNDPRVVMNDKQSAVNWQAAAGSAYVAVLQSERDPKFDDVEHYRQIVADLYDSVIIHPQGKNLIRWNAFMMFMLAFSAYLVPFEIAFTRTHLNSESYIGFGCDCVFVIDTIMQFFIAFETGIGYHYCFDHKQIVWHYLCTMFLIDACSCLSVSNLFLLYYEHYVWVVPVLRYARLLRLARYGRCKKRWGFELGFSYVTTEVLINGITITLATHWIGCAWGVSATYDPERNWVQAQLEKSENTSPYAGTSHWHEGTRNYFVALYFGIYLMTGIGLGDIVPVNIAERAVAMLCMIGGAVAWATVIASIVGIVTQKKEHGMMLQQQMDAVNKLAEDDGYPESLRVRVREYLVMHRHLAGKSESDAVSNLSPRLQMEVTMMSHGEWLMKVKYFKRLVNPRSGEGTQFLVEIAWAMEPQLHQPGELIKLLHHLCVVVRGIGFLEGGVCFRNSVWGADFLIRTMKLRKSAHVLCLTYMQIKVLALERFNTILSHFPQERKAVQRERVKLIMVRGMVYRARAELRRRAKDSGSSEHLQYKQLGRAKSFVDFAATKTAGGKANRHSHLPSVEDDGNEEDGEHDEDHAQEIVGQANMPEFVSQIKRTQDLFRDETNKRFDQTNRRLSSIEATLEKISERLENVRSTPWSTC